MFDDLAYLRPYKATAHLLAEKADWPALYLADRLALNTRPVASAVYLEDMWV